MMAEPVRHALLAPSAAARWLFCPASARLTAELPEEPAGPYAAEGTRAHRMAELMLSGVNPPADSGAELAELSRDEDMARYVLQYVERVQAIAGTAPDYFAVEDRLDISVLTGEPGAAGTADALIVAGGVLHVCDLKFGRGVKVNAEGNEQLSLYALAALDALAPLYDIREAQLHIMQPRLGHFSDWTLSLAQAEQFRASVKARAARALQLAGDPEAEPGADDFAPLAASWRGEPMAAHSCRWCRAKATCPAFRAHMTAAVAASFPAVPEAEPARAVIESLPVPADPDSLARAWRVLPMLEAWTKEVAALAQRRMEAGEKLPGLKLVQGRQGARRWKDARLAEGRLRKMRIKVEDMYDLKVISPAAAEKLFRKKVLGPRQWEDLSREITRDPPKVAVALEEDRRPAVEVPAPAEQFEKLEGEA